MGVYKRGNTYGIDYYWEGKRIQKAVGPDRKLAEMVLKKRLVEIAEGKHLDIKRTPKTKFEELVSKYFKDYAIPEIKRSWHSDVDTIKVLNRWFGGKYLHEITPELVTKFKVERKREVSVATTNRGLACLRTMLNKAKEWVMFDGDNPVAKVKLFKENNKRLRFLEQEEIEKLLANCSEHLKPIVICALHTGMRKSEILHLKWRDCDFRRNIIYVTESKNGERREIPMDEFLKKTLIAIPKHPESPYIFCNKDGQPYGDIKKSFLTALKNSDIILPLGTKFHALRHSFASHLVMSGVDLNTVKDLMGHKSIEMTLRYSHLSPSHKKRAVDLLCQRIAKKPLQDSDKLVTQAKIQELSTEPIFDNSLEHKELVNT
ncbi:MAG: site-specific integrase [Candidatus Omnitrophica bacterium]|nr:site-specific integrase [Candidatus Omnitrophota bacterium]